MKKKLILLWPYGFREYDWKRLELSELSEKENIEVEVHELVSFLIPDLTRAYQTLLVNSKIKKFKSFLEWKKYMKLQIDLTTKEKKELLILKHSLNENLNLNFLLVNREIKKLKLKTLELFGRHHPIMTLKKKFNILYLLKSIFKHLKNINLLISILKKYLFDFLFLNFYKGRNIILSFNTQIPKKLISKETSIIKANSFDYSMALKNIKTFKSSNNDLKYALFLESPGPLHPGDELIWGGQNEGFTKEKWFPSLNKYFDKLESILGLKVIIAPHPKVKHEKNPSYYGGREISEQILAESALNSELIISHWSSGISFGVIYNKPIMLITSNELINNEEFVRQQNQFSKELGSEIINIDSEVSEGKLKQKLIINKTKYNEYILNYCSSRDDKKRNYQIILDIIKNKHM